MFLTVYPHGNSTPLLLFIEVACGKVPLQAGWERSALQRKRSFGKGSFAYAAGVLLSRVRKKLEFSKKCENKNTTLQNRKIRNFTGFSMFCNDGFHQKLSMYIDAEDQEMIPKKKCQKFCAELLPY